MELNTQAPFFADLHRIQTLLRKAGIDCLIAGGAVRDTLFSRPVKDIDVFIDTRIYSPEVWLPRISKALSTQFAEQDLDSETYIEGEDLTIYVEAMPKDDKPPINLIFRDTPLDEIVESFDFSICQCWMTSDGQPSWGQNFGTTVALKRAFYLRGRPESEWEYHREVERRNRLGEKYPEFQFEPVPPMLLTPAMYDQDFQL